MGREFLWRRNARSLTFEQRCMCCLRLVNRIWQCLSQTAQRLPCQQEGEARRGNPSVNLQAAGMQPSHAQAAASSERGRGVLGKQTKLYVPSFRGSVTWERTSLQTGQKYCENLKRLKRTVGCLAASVACYSGVFALVGSGCGGLHAEVTGCGLGWLECGVTCVCHRSSVVRELW